MFLRIALNVYVSYLLKCIRYFLNLLILLLLECCVSVHPIMNNVILFIYHDEAVMASLLIIN